MSACYPKKHYLFISLCVAVFAVFFVFIPSSYSQENNFDKERALRVVSEKGGPGGCDSEASCATFCDNSNNLETCMNWARSNGVVVSEEAVQKHSKIIREGGPGGCRTSEECHAFCEQPQNHDVCIDHAVQQGFMTAEDAKKIKEFQTRAKEFRKKTEEFRGQKTRRPEVKEIEPGFDKNKARQILSVQGGPGGCATFEECETFCDNPDNQLTCFEFAEKNGLFQNSAEAEKIKRIMQEGGPGGCRGERACHQFCENEANFETCISFAEKSGLMPPGEIEKAKKGIQALKEGGPGGCKTRESCEQVCRNPANQQSCFEWAKKHGLMSEEELKFIEEAQKMREEFESKRQQFEGEFRPPEGFGPPGVDFGASECAKQGGSWGPDKETGKETCNFPEGPIEQGPHVTPPPGSEYRGPGGCSTPDECKVYCETHPQECYGVTPPGDGPGYQTGPKTGTDFNADECLVRGGNWDGSKCNFYNLLDEAAKECASRGGEWRQAEGQCYFPPPPSSFINHPFLGAISRYLLK